MKKKSKVVNALAKGFKEPTFKKEKVNWKALDEELQDGYKPFDVDIGHYWDRAAPDRFKITISFDVRFFHIKTIIKLIQKVYHFYRKKVVTERRKGRYSIIMKDMVTMLEKEGLSQIDILRRLNPRLKKFRYNKDYVEKSQANINKGTLYAVRELKRINRILIRGKEESGLKIKTV